MSRLKENPVAPAHAWVAAFFARRPWDGIPWGLIAFFATAFLATGVGPAFVMFHEGHLAITDENPLGIADLVTVCAAIVAAAKFAKLQADRDLYSMRTHSLVELTLLFSFLVVCGLATGFELSTVALEAQESGSSVLALVASREHATYFILELLIIVISALLYASELPIGRRRGDNLHGALSRVEVLLGDSVGVIRSAWYRPEAVEKLLERTELGRFSPATLALLGAHVIRAAIELGIAAFVLAMVAMEVDFREEWTALTSSGKLTLVLLCVFTYGLVALATISAEMGYVVPLGRGLTRSLYRMLAWYFGFSATLLLASMILASLGVVPLIGDGPQTLLAVPLILGTMQLILWFVDFLDPVYFDSREYDPRARKSMVPTANLKVVDLPEVIDGMMDDQILVKQLSSIEIAAELGGILAAAELTDFSDDPEVGTMGYRLQPRRGLRAPGRIRSLRLQAACDKIAYDHLRGLVGATEQVVWMRSGYATYQAVRPGDLLPRA